MTDFKTRVTEFIEKNYQKLNSYAEVRVSNILDKDGDDIVQDVMLNLFQGNISSKIDNIAGYLYKCIRNRIIDESRKQKVETFSLNNKLNSENSVEFIESLCESTSEEAHLANRKHNIMQALNCLDAMTRLIIIENVMNKKTMQEIADKLRLPLGTILSRKSRGIKKLKQKLLKLEEKDV